MWVTKKKSFSKNDLGYNVKQQENYGDDPIVVIDLIGKLARLAKT
jgi:hypothetical protein